MIFYPTHVFFLTKWQTEIHILSEVVTCIRLCNIIQIYPVSEGYLRKILVERRGKFDCPRNRYFSQITLTNRIYLFNSADYLTASKTVACKQVQNFRPPRSFDFQLRLKINLRKQEKSFQRSDQCINSGTNSKIK